jgi:hypothetical protein
MAQIREETVRAGAVALGRGDPAANAVEFLRRELSEEVQDQFREIVRVDALGALDAIVGRVVQQMLRCNGFGERELGVESLGTAWRDLVRRAVT